MNKALEAKENRLSPELLAGILLVLFFGIALYLRVYLPYARVFSGDWIKFTGIDAYFNMHLVDNLARNFPHPMSFDPYFLYPSSPGATVFRFFTWLLAAITWVIGLGSPTQHTVDVVGVYFPAVLGALTVIPVYFIGKELFNRWAGVLSAGLIAITPGEFLGRSILGFTDYHVAEVLFSTLAILFLILAIKTARQRRLTFNHLYRGDWVTSTKPLIYSLLAGIFLGIYLLTWMGALLFVFIISLYFIIQFIIDHLKRQSTDYLCLVGVILFFIALLMFLPASPTPFYLVPLIAALFIPLVLSGTSRLTASKGLRPAYYPLTLFGIGLVGLLTFYIISPSLLGKMLGAFSIFTPTGASLTTIEMQPLLFPGGPGSNFSLSVAWGNFTTGFFLWPGRPFLDFSLILLGIFLYIIIKKRGEEAWLIVVLSLVILLSALGNFTSWFTVQPDSRLYNFPFPSFSFISLGILIYLIIKQGSAEKSLLVVWSVIILLATLGQRRFAYYFAVNVALLTGYLSWQILEFAGFKELIARPVELPTRAERKRAKPKKEQEARFHLTTTHISISLSLIVIFFLVFFPNIGRATATAKQAPFAPSDAWISSLTWLKENTPDPFGNPDFYYELHKPLPPGERYNYPESAYGVMAWWDYGYWISRIAHRLPNANPSQSPVALTNVGRFFTAQDEDSAIEIVQEMDSSYVIIDYETAVVLVVRGIIRGKFYAVAMWAGSSPEEFFDVYLEPQEDKLIPRLFYHPEYYRSLLVRLYTFDGQAVTPKESIVISYEERASQEGKPVKIATDIQTFPSYEAARDYISSQKSVNYKIVGNSPFNSPVPLEALKHYKLLYSSDNSVTQPGIGSVPQVKIFEYIK